MLLSRARLMVRLGLALLLLGAAVIAFTLITSQSDDLPVRGELTLFIAFVGAGVGLLVAWIGWRTLRLASDASIIACWTVSPDEWQRYVAACTMRVTMPGTFPNSVSLDQPVPASGVEVLALKHGFRVGDAFHELGSLNAEILDMRVVDAPADMFEFNVRYTMGRHRTVSLGVRIPIASSTKQLANQVEDYWTGRRSHRSAPSG